MAETEIDSDGKSLLRDLSAPFKDEDVEWKAQATTGNRCLAVAYVDARVVIDRLNEVFGVGNWQTECRIHPEVGAVVCRLSVLVHGRWAVYEGVGAFSDQPHAGDKVKAGASDALKRSAVHLGVGRYLYDLPKTWVDYDPQRKQIVTPPRASALARQGRPPGRPAAPAPRTQQQQQQPAQPAAPTGSYEPTEAEKKLLNVLREAFNAAETHAKLETARQAVQNNRNLSQAAKELLRPHYNRNLERLRGGKAGNGRREQKTG